MNDARRKISNVLWPIFGVLTVVLLCFLALNACVMMTKPVPNRFRVGLVRSGEQSLSTVLPYGHHHELVLGIPRAERNHAPAFTAAIRFRNGERVSAAVNVHSTNAVPCNWVQPGNLQGFILTWPNTNEWEHSLVPGHQYQVDCQFDGNLPSDSSLWVSCLQTGIDRWKTKRNRTKP